MALPTKDVLRDRLWRGWFSVTRVSIFLHSWNLKPELARSSSVAWTRRAGLPLRSKLTGG